jgi:hypothetical protein
MKVCTSFDYHQMVDRGKPPRPPAGKLYSLGRNRFDLNGEVRTHVSMNRCRWSEGLHMPNQPPVITPSTITEP